MTRYYFYSVDVISDDKDGAEFSSGVAGVLKVDDDRTPDQIFLDLAKACQEQVHSNFMALKRAYELKEEVEADDPKLYCHFKAFHSIE